jgi:hypothetical protein
MAIVYQQGQTLGRGDLDIYLTNAEGNPANAYTISYGIYYVDPTSCAEVLIGPSDRTPVNPAVGEYYAALQVPGTAAPGTYRIRWLVQETSATPQTGAVQEFGVVSSQVATTANTMTTCMADLVRKMRVLTRDNCLGEETEVLLSVAGEPVVVSLGDLYEALHDLSPPPPR